MILGWEYCMEPYCTSCEINGREQLYGTLAISGCISACMTNQKCKGIDFGTFPWNKHKCYLALEDVKDVDTTYTPAFKAYRKNICLRNTLSNNDHSPLKVKCYEISIMFHLKLQ